MDESTPQLENGFTRLANELLDALLLAGLTARQWAVVMAVVRKTYGFNKKSDEIGLSQLSLITGIDKSHVSRAVRELEALNVLTREAGVHGHRLGLNKNYKQWGVAESATRLLNQQQLLKEQPGVAESAILGVAELAIPGLPNQQPQKTTIKDKVKTTPKDTLSRSLRERFDVFWAMYPKKKSKDTAEKAFAKRNPDEQLFADIIGGLERAKTSVDWLKDGGEYVPHAASWLNAGGWKDEYKAACYSVEETAVIDAYNSAMPEAWPRAVAAPFVAARSAAIRDFLGIAPTKPEMPKNYFSHCAANLAVDERCGFDWLIRKETYLRVREGAVKHKEPA